MSVTPRRPRDDNGTLDAVTELFVRYRDRGDLAALGVLFDQLAPRLLGLALHLCAHAADAEDALQATFVVAMRKASAFDEQQPVAPWLAGILAGEARNAARTTARSRGAPLPEIGHHNGDPAAEAERRELVAQLRTRIDALPEEQRQAMLLQFQHGLQPAEIAEVLRVPPGTVRMRLHRGLRALRRWLPASLVAWWTGALPERGLACVRTAVMARGKVAAAAAVGGLVTTQKAMTVVALALAVLAMFVVVKWSGTADTPSTSVSHEHLVTAAASPPPGRDREPMAQKTVARSELPTPDTLRLRAVDADSRPVAATRLLLTILVRRPDGAELPLLHRLRTDAAGICEVSAETRSWSPQCELLRATVHAELLGGEGADVPLDPRATAEIVDVPVPPFGQLQVALFGQDGEPVRQPEHSRMEIQVSAQKGVETAHIGADGCAVVPHVACGSQLRVRRPWSSGAEDAEQDVAGPSSNGDTVRIDLHVPASAVVLTGRLLHGDRRPLDGSVSVWEAASSPLLAVIGIDSDLAVAADGSFRVVLRDHMRGRHEIYCRSLGKNGEPDGEEADLATGMELHAGRNELGDVVLTRSPLLVAGRVTASDGQTPAGVALQLEYSLSTLPSWHPFGMELPLHIDAEGRFAVYSSARAAKYRVQLRAPGRPQVIEFTAGTSDLVLRPDHGGSVTATFLDGALVELLEVKLVPPVLPSEHRAAIDLLTRMRVVPRRADARVRYHWDGLDPGDYGFVVANGTRTLLQVPIHVGEGELQDARLTDIDLRNQVHSLRVQVTDAAGARLSVSAAIYVHGSSDPADWAAQGLMPDGISIATFPVGQPVDLCVVAKGWRARMLTAVSGDVRVVMSPAAKFTLHCAQLIGTGLRTRLTWRLGTAIDPNALRVANDSQPVQGLEQQLLGDGFPAALVDGSAPASFSGLGSVTLGIRVRSQDGWTPMLPVQPGTIDGDAITEGQTVELRLDPTALQKALDELQKQQESRRR